MADKTTGELESVSIGDLAAAPDIYDDLKMPGEMQGDAVHITGAQFKKYAQSATKSFAESAYKSAATAEGAKTAAQSALDGVREALNSLPEGDTLIINDLTTGGTTAALSAEMGKVLNRRPNPNLLHNWYFARCVNQRGFASKTNPVGYFVDRWSASTTASTTVSVGGNGMTITNGSTSGVAYIRQYFEVGAVPPGVYTMSVLAENVVGKPVIVGKRRVEEGGLTSSKQIVDGLTSHTVTVDVELERVQFQIPAGASLTIKAVKLELGDTQTLAHWDGSKYVLNEIPDFGEELAKCQRYFLSVNVDPFGTGYTVGGGGNADILIPTPQTMRGTPALVTDGTFKARVNGMDYTSANTYVQSVAGNCVEIRMAAEGCPAAQAAAGFLSGATYFYLDANL